MFMILALYLRLSREDDELEDESNSITNQRLILRKYIEQRPEFQGYTIKEYADDGYSGRNFERPAVKELLEDVRTGKVYGILVKDFSRFGRNLIEVGDYIEKIFPLLDVRFIAVNNHFDSADYDGTTPDMDVSFQNLMYDYSSAENSVKIKGDLFNRRKSGNFLASFAPLGYMKSPQNHNQLIIDPDAAWIIRIIFDKYSKWGVKAQVARYLNDNKVPTPLQYAVRKGKMKRWKYAEEEKFWSGAIVGKIIKNPVYIGHSVFHKSEVQEPASSQRIFLPKEEWNVCENVHEPIISKELFEWVNSTEFLEQITGDQQKKEKRKPGSKDSPIKGFVKCGGCRHSMVRRNRANASYYCRYYYESKREECCKENIKEADLIEIVKAAICRQAMVAADLRKLLKIQKDAERRKRDLWIKQKEQLEKEIQKLQNENFELYEKYKEAQLSREVFAELRKKCQERIQYLQNQLEEYAGKEVQENSNHQNVLDLLEGKENIAELTREMMEQLISKIYVYGRNRVEIIFNYRDEWEVLVKSTKGYKK